MHCINTGAVLLAGQDAYGRLVEQLLPLQVPVPQTSSH